VRTAVRRAWTAHLAGGIMLLLVQAAGACLGAPSPSVYTLTDLGLMDAHGLNGRGQVVGMVYVNEATTAESRAVLYDGIRRHDLGTLGKDYNTQYDALMPGYNVAYAINDAGQVVGYATPAGKGYYGRHAFLYSDGVMQDLGTLGGYASEARAINAAGQVVGGAATADSPSAVDAYTGHAFLYDRSGMHDLGTLGGLWSMAYGINTAGQIAGSAVLGQGSPTGLPPPITWHGFLADGSGLRDLGLGGQNSHVYGINDRGQVVGAMDVQITDHPSEMGQHAFLDDGRERHDLGTLRGWFSAALGINNAGDVVGWSEIELPAEQNGYRPHHAFLYHSGRMIDLNSVLPPASGWFLNEGRAINDAGQIAGEGTLNGQPHGFLLTPGTGAPALPPHAPTSLTAQSIFSSVAGNSSELDLSWVDNSTNEQSFELQTQQSDGTWATVENLPANEASFAHTGLQPYHHYAYRVRAINDAGASDWSNVAGGDTGFQAIAQLSTPTGQLAFGSQPLGTSGRPLTLTLTNSGNAPLSISRVTLAGGNAGDYQITADSGSSMLAPGSTRTITLQFTPMGSGPRYTYLILRDNAPDTEQQIYLVGAGTLPVAGTPGLVLPVKAELEVMAVDDVPFTEDTRVVSVGQRVRLWLWLKFKNGATAPLATDPNTHFSAGFGRGTFSAAGVWSATAADAGRTVTMTGTWTLPHSGRRWTSSLTLVVRAQRRRK
jgi:probable HAF family extracellular repeat protein